MTCAWHTENQSSYQYLLAEQSKPTITSCVEPAMCEEPCIGKLKGISHRQDCTGKQCPWIAIRLPALLVEGIPQAPMNAEFHSAAARPMDAFDHDQLTAGRGLFLFRHRVPPPCLRADPHWPLLPTAPAFPRGSAGTRHRSFSFSPAAEHTRLAAP